VDEYDNTPADPTDTNEFDAEEFAHHENPPGAAQGRGNMNNPRAVPTMEEIEQNLFDDYKKFISEADVAEGGVGDMIINAIEAVRMAKPGLKQQDFLDELYMYIENQNGQRAAEMMSNAGQAEYDEWYDNYLDTAEEGIEDRLKDLDPKNPVNIPAYQRKAASGDSASAARNTEESANENMTDILKLSGLK
jgi:hypothetical protein